MQLANVIRSYIRRHQLTPEEAKQIASTIPRIAIIHGTDDKLLHVDRGRDLHAELPVSLESANNDLGATSSSLSRHQLTLFRCFVGRVRPSRLSRMPDTLYRVRYEMNTTTGSEKTSKPRHRSS